MFLVTYLDSIAAIRGITNFWLKVLCKKRGCPDWTASMIWQLPTLPLGIAVPSAQTGLTSLFGMGRGGAPSL